MNSFTDGLKEKIQALSDEKEELEDALQRVEIKLETLSELLDEELILLDDSSDEVNKSPVRRRRKTTRKKSGRKTAKKIIRATKNKKLERANVEDYEEAVRTLPGGKGTTPEEADAAKRRFKPVPRPQPSYGSVKVGGNIDKLRSEQKQAVGHTKMTIEEDK